MESSELIACIQCAERILVFTGAGISTGSGIPDFRGPQGVWKTRQPVYYQEFMSSEKARKEHLDYKMEAWEAFRNAQPNPVHHAIVKLQQAGKLLMVVTQNIDGLHSAAGLPDEKVVEIHGTNRAIECQTCGAWSDPEPFFETYRKTKTPPVCSCGGFLKPATVSFGQNLREVDLKRATGAAQKADLVIALGSTLSVYPAASIPLMAAERGIPYIIINQGETDQDDHETVTLRIEGDVGAWFPPAVKKALG